MSLVGSRVVGLLLVWMSAGFAFDAATAQYQHDVLLEALEPEERGDIAAPTRVSQAVTAGTGGVLLLVGLALLARPPGEGRVPGWRIGDRVEAAARLRRCWRCRKRWPEASETCPNCGARRLT